MWGPVLGSGTWVLYLLGYLMHFLMGKMVHGSKKATLSPCEDSCCNIEVRIVCVSVSLNSTKGDVKETRLGKWRSDMAV